MDTYSKILLILNTISIVSSLLVLIAYIFSDKIKTFLIKQICKLCFFDLLFSLGNLFIKDSFLDSSNNEFYCYTSFFLKYTGGEASQMVTCLISFLICSSLKACGDLQKLKKIRKLSSYLTIALVLISLSLAIIPMALKQVSMQGYFCYISSDDDTGKTMRMFIQFIPQFVYLFIMMYFTTYAYYLSVKNKCQVSKKFLLFPLAMLITQIPIVVERLYERIGDEEPVKIWVDISYIFLSINGFINIIIYGLCTDIFSIMKESLVSCCVKFSEKTRRSSTNSYDNSYLDSSKNDLQKTNYQNTDSIGENLIISKKNINS